MATDLQSPPAAPERPRRRSGPTMRQSENRAGLAFLSPTLAVVLVVVVAPILWTVMLAFQQIRLVNIRRAGVFGNYSLDNFSTVFGSPGFWSSLLTTVIYSVGSTVLSVLLGLIAALALRRPFKGRTG